jgi:hypothetical protein
MQGSGYPLTRPSPYRFQLQSIGFVAGSFHPILANPIFTWLTRHAFTYTNASRPDLSRAAMRL